MEDYSNEIEVLNFKKLKYFEKASFCTEIIKNCDKLNADIVLKERIITQENIINSIIKEKDDLIYQVNKLFIENNILNNKSKIFKIELSKILTFNEQHKANYTDNKKNVEYTKEFYNYKQEIFELLHNYKNDLIKIINNKNNKNNKLKLYIDFQVNNSSKDLDNIFKPFIDVLFMFLGDNYNDNQIAQISTNRNKITGTKYNNETIYFYFENICEKEIIEQDLSYMYEKQKSKEDKEREALIEFRKMVDSFNPD